jgi:hypothetical protein
MICISNLLAALMLRTQLVRASLKFVKSFTNHSFSVTCAIFRRPCMGDDAVADRLVLWVRQGQETPP